MKQTHHTLSHDHQFLLSGGMRCVHRRVDSPVSYIGIVVGAGSRDEDASHGGLAHFVEHTIFKGTRNRSSWHISNRMESVGGELNAYTSKEETVVYTAAPAGNTSRALELLADLVRYSTFPADELVKEREVVIEEIKSYLDSPSESVYDKFEERIYDGSPLAHNILGDPESVRRLSGVDCRGFIEDFYTSDDMVLYIVDPSPVGVVERMAEKYFGPLHLLRKDSGRTSPIINPSFEIIDDGEGYQAHTVIGARVFSRYDSRRFALFLLNNYLGGPCMNSRLNQELRERRGWVYTVDSSVGLLSDCGTLQIYFGSDRSHLRKCRELVLHEIDKLAQSPLSSVKFERIRRQYVGQLLLSADHRESVAMSLGKSILYYGDVHDVTWTMERMLQVTPQDVCDVAQLLMTNGFSSFTIC